MIAPKEIKDLVANYLSISNGLANELAAIATLVHYKKGITKCVVERGLNFRNGMMHLS